MEGNLSQGGMIQGGTSFGGFDFPEPMWLHCLANNPNTMNQHQTHPCGGSSLHPSINEDFPLALETLPNCDQTMSITKFSKGDISRNSSSDEDEPSFNDGDGEGHHDAGRGKTGSTWQRMKWTDKMVRLMITAVSYIGEDTTSDYGSGRRKFAVIQKKVLRNNDDIRRSNHDEDDEDMETEDQDFKDNYASHGDSRRMHNPLGGAMNKLRQGQGQDDATTYVDSLNCQEHTKNLYPHGQMEVQSDMNQALHEGARATWLQQKRWIESRSLQLEEQKLQIQVDMLELEKQRYKWQKFSQKKDRQLEKLRMENERMKHENELIALELKRKEMDADFN
ncbi:hypothetical protein Lalb_Chr03g0035281 [Lupinus albus]|uniref:Uncharacterized protein n=1 Tax=Lupinus albus TaxID=3870 RepID=A0A6A4QSU1_LUPAL|nr:hypothetical protein Lalb_Chr03g0035281 [Lupinus albus]